jgi:hypothetical protein
MPSAPIQNALPLPNHPPSTSNISYAHYTPTASEIEVYNLKRKIIGEWRTELEGSNDELSYAQGRGVGSADWSYAGSSESGTVPTTIIGRIQPPTGAPHYPLYTPHQPLRSPPVPLLAKAPSQQPPMSERLLHKPVPLAPGDVLYPPPAAGSSHSQREAYISSALDLPMDLLTLRNGESSSTAIRMTAAERGRSVSAPRSQLKGLDKVEVLQEVAGPLGRSHTAGSRLGEGVELARGGKQTAGSTQQLPTPAHSRVISTTTKRVVSAPIHGPPASREGKTATSYRSRTKPGLPVEVPPKPAQGTLSPVQYLTPGYQPAKPVPSMGSQQSRRSEQSARVRQVSGSEAVRSLGSQRSHRSRQGVQHSHLLDQGDSSLGPPIVHRGNGESVEEDIQTGQPARPPGTERYRQSSNNLDRSALSPPPPLAPPPSPRHPTSARQDPSVDFKSKPLPAPGHPAVPPHRQQLPLPRPALAQSSSSYDVLGRRLRDPSTTSLTARFEPIMYPLPPSKTTDTHTSPEIVSLPTLPVHHVSYLCFNLDVVLIWTVYSACASFSSINQPGR